MDLIEQAKIEYEYFKLAKRIENFSFRCHYFEIEIDRIIDLVSVINNKFSESEHCSNFSINMPYDIYREKSDIHHNYYEKYRFFISDCHSNPDLEWINPISISNQMEVDITDAKKSLEGLPLTASLSILRVMLMSLMDEAASIEEEETNMIKAHNNPSSLDINGYLNNLSEILEDYKKIELQMIKDAEIAGDNEKIERLKKMFLKSPFQRTHEIIRNVLIPQVDAILSSLC